jgi:hypothetical protein
MVLSVVSCFCLAFSSATQVFLYLLFLQLEALVLPGRSLRRQASTLITYTRSTVVILQTRNKTFKGAVGIPCSVAVLAPESYPAWAANDWMRCLEWQVARLNRTTTMQSSQIMMCSYT